MFTKWGLRIVGLLILLNVVLWLWPDKHGRLAPTESVKRDLNADSIRLAKELSADALIPIEVTEPSLPVTEDVVEPEPIDAETPEVAATLPEETAPEPVEVESEPAAANCFRIGPFFQTAAFEQAKLMVEQGKVSLFTPQARARRSQVYRVFLGPYAQEDALQQALQLVQIQQLDHFQRTQSDGETFISLGIYMTEESANAALAQLPADLSMAKKRIEQVELPNSNWLHFSLNSNPEFLPQLESSEWGEPTARFEVTDCSEQ